MRPAAVKFGMFLLLAIPLAAEDCPERLARGRQAYEARRFETAVAEFEGALQTCGSQAQVLLALGEAQLMAGRLQPSVASLQNAVKLQPDNAMARKVLGDALYLEGQEPLAEESLQAALAVDPRFEPALYALGRIYYQQNRFPEAVRQFQKLVEIDPGNYRAHDNLGLCYDALQNDAEALRHFFKALDLVYRDHPDYDWAHADLAEFFLKRNQYEKAFQLAAEAAQRNPKAARNFFLTGKALVGLHREEQSLRWLERAVALDADYREAHYVLARAYQKLGRTADAEREFGKVKELENKPEKRR